MRVLLIVLYRFGLRTGEAAEITLGGLFMHPNRQVSIHVKRSTLTTCKSTNALRMVGPINLPDDEYCCLADFRQRREQSTPGRHRELAATYLFSSPGTNGLENVLLSQKMLVEAVRTTSGDPNLRARHFRHSFVSRQYLSGRDALGLLNTDTLPIDEWRRAFWSGHAVPDTGIISYTHGNEIAHYFYARRVVSNEVSEGLLSQLAGNKDRSLERASLRSGASVSVADRFLQSLRVNFPIDRFRDLMRPRMRYFDFSLTVEEEPDTRQDDRLDFESAWEVYRCARIGTESKQAGEHAVRIRERVRELLLTERLALRIRRRPQLSADERMAALRLWQSLNDDVALQQVLGQAASWLRANRYRINMPADIARTLEYRLARAGLSGVTTTSGNRQMRWFECRTNTGKHTIGWVEVVAFLSSGSVAS